MAQSAQESKNLGIGCLVLIYIFACIVFPWLLLAIPVWLIVLIIKTKPSTRAGTRGQGHRNC